MININLVVKPAPRLRWRRVAAGLGAGLTLMGVTMFILTGLDRLESARADLDAVVSLEASYGAVLEKARDLTEREKALSRQVEQLAVFGRNQGSGGQSPVLRAVFAAAPANVTVTEVLVEKDGTLVITGQAPDFAAAMTYLKVLRGLPVLGEVQERKLAAPAKGITTFTFAAPRRREGRP